MSDYLFQMCADSGDVLELPEAQVLGDDENLLSVLVGSEDLRALPDDKHTIVGIEETEQVVCVRYDVPARVLVRWHRIDLS